VNRRMDKRRLVIPTVLFATLVLGFGLQKIATGRAVAGYTADDPQGVLVNKLEPRGHQLQLHFQQAVALLQQGEFEIAAHGFYEVLKHVPELPEAHVNLGFAMLGLKKFEEAQGHFDRASNIRPGQSNAYYGLAVASEGLGDLPQAVTAMRAYVHIAEADDPYRRKAEAAIWEWEAALPAQANGD